MPKLLAYDKDLPYSYALGIFPSIRLMETRPEAAQRLLLESENPGGEGIEKLRALCRARGIREECAPRTLARESKKENCHAAMVFSKFSDQLSDERPHVVLCQVSDGGNLGSILRTCLGFGVRDVAVIRPAADLFDPRVIRASMGAAFSLRVTVLDCFEEYRARHPLHTLYPFMLTGSSPLPQAAKAPPALFSLVFGNEQRGLPPEMANLGRAVRIPQTGQIDSYNLSAAAAIALYAFFGSRAESEGFFNA